jgi:putative hydrolase of the HAD superfamily
MNRPDIRTWVFDLDNTLYPASELYDEIGERMTSYIARAVGVDAAEALLLREKYFHEYGATIVGLVRHHGVDARDFLADVHEADHSVLVVDDELRGLIEQLPGRRIVFTNGGGGHPERVLATLGLAHCFDTIFDIEAAGLTPKPQRACYERLVETCGFEPRQAILIEDTLRNLPPAHEMGFVTALVGEIHAGPHPAYLSYHATELKHLLRDLASVASAAPKP